MRIITTWALLTILTFFFLLSGSKAQAQVVLYQDNFNDGNISDWKVIRNQIWGPLPMPCMNGVWPSAWHIEDGMMSFEIDGTACVSEIIPITLDLTQTKNYQVDFDWILADSIYMDRNMVFRWQDTQNWYGIKLFGNDILLQKVSEEGNNNSLRNNYASFPFEPNGRYHFSITMTEDFRITVSIDGQTVIDSYDKWPPQQNWDQKTIALQASAGGVRQSKTYFDNLIVKSLDQTSNGELAMPHFKQNDPLWSETEYDTASQWAADFTFKRWGCAVTSMAMLLHYYDITILPDGIPLTPASLNDWLQSQVDGYIGQGLTNWLAITRLTRLLSEQNGTPKLEYNRIFGNSLAGAQSEIEQQKPVILQLPGHFIVGNGTKGANDLAIMDPFYDHILLSQHSTELLSTRTFEPSFTDLSYLLVTHDPKLSVTITDEHNQPVENIQTYDEHIDAKPTSGKPNEQTQKVTIHQLAKPDSGHYRVAVSQPKLGPFTVQILAYDDQANPTVLSQTGVVGPEPLIFDLNYQKQKESQIKPMPVTFNQLRQDLQMLKKQKQIKKSRAFSKLDRILAKAEKASTEQAARHITIWKKTLAQSKRSLTTDGFTYLTQQTKRVAESLVQ